jgi:phage repressor protein C with HTH and peptisase S24 domain
MADIKGKFPNGLADAMKRKGVGSTALAGLIGDSKQNVTRWANQSRRLTPDTAELMAPHLDTTAAALVLIADRAPDLTPPKPALAGPAAPAVQEVIPGPDFDPSDQGPRDIPVLGTAMGGTEQDERPIDFWLTGEVENHVVRPKGLLRARNVFALYVGGDSMEPRFEERDMVYVQKTSPGIGDDVVIELHPLVDGGDHPTFIKRLVRRNGSFITVKQYNPPKELEFTVKEIKNLFRVIPLKELMG